MSDRIDIALMLDSAAPVDTAPGEWSATVAGRVAAARAAAAHRWASDGFRVNTDIPLALLRHRPFRLSASATSRARRMLDTGQLSQAGYRRILRMARTISDLRGAVHPDAEAVERAVDLYAQGRP